VTPETYPFLELHDQPTPVFNPVTRRIEKKAEISNALGLTHTSLTKE